MIDHNDLRSVQVFAAESEYTDPTYPAGTNYSRGFEPLETLPAAWYNQLMKILTTQAQATKSVVDSLYAEIASVIEEDGTALDSTKTTQLLGAIKKLAEIPQATATALGGILSSSAANKVLVQADGTAQLNAMSDWNEQVDGASLKQYIATYVASHSGNQYQFFPDYSNAGPWITAWTDENGYTATKNGWFAISIGWGVIDTEIYITVNSTLVYLAPYPVASTAPSFALSVAVTAGDVINITTRRPTGHIQLPLVDSNTPAGNHMRFIPVKTVSDAPEIHATSATYLRPPLSNSTRVTADEYGNLTAHEQILKTAAEFDDGGEDIYQ